MQKLKRKPIGEKLNSIVESLLNTASRLKQLELPWPLSPWTTVYAAILILILLLLLGCSAPAPRILPPEAAARPMPILYGSTAVDALMGIPLYREWGLACEADKELIRSTFGEEQ